MTLPNLDDMKPISREKLYKVIVTPYSLLNVGPGADPGVHAVSPRMTLKVTRRLTACTPGSAPGQALTKERQAWCNLQVKLCDPCLSVLRLNAV